MLNRDDRERLLARVSDLLRRGGTEDAEHLIRDLEAAIGGPVFTAGGDFVFMFHAAVPAGDVRSDRPILQFLDPAYCAAFTTRGVFPFPFECLEAHAGSTGPVPSVLYLVVRDHGAETARFPPDAFTGPFALAFERRFHPHERREIELWATRPIHAPAPWAVSLTLSGFARGSGF